MEHNRIIQSQNIVKKKIVQFHVTSIQTAVLDPSVACQKIKQFISVHFYRCESKESALQCSPSSLLITKINRQNMFSLCCIKKYQIGIYVNKLALSWKREITSPDNKYGLISRKNVFLRKKVKLLTFLKHFMGIIQSE